MRLKLLAAIAGGILGAFLLAEPSLAASASAAPVLSSARDTLQGLKAPSQISSSLQILFLLTVLTLAPSILVMVTSFTRIIIVLSLLRQAISLPSMPPNQIIIGLSLFLSLFIMAPTWNAINDQALKPYMKGQITEAVAMDKAVQPLRAFMLKQTRKKDLALFIHLAKLPKPKNISEVPTYVIIPSFIISELKTAFEIGFLLFIPFLVIDIITASVLMSMGMMMVPPMMFSLPFKLLLFVLVDGWNLLMRGLVMSFR